MIESQRPANGWFNSMRPAPINRMRDGGCSMRFKITLPDMPPHILLDRERIVLLSWMN